MSYVQDIFHQMWMPYLSAVINRLVIYSLVIVEVDDQRENFDVLAPTL